MSDADLAGWVVVVAGDDAALGEVSRAAAAAGAAVGVVSAELTDEIPATVRFRADPRDPDAWQRIAMHIEQHLGPIDGVVTDDRASGTVQQVFEADLARRGRSAVLVMSTSDSPEAVITRLVRTPPAAPSPLRHEEPDR